MKSATLNEFGLNSIVYSLPTFKLSHDTNEINKRQQCDTSTFLKRACGRYKDRPGFDPVFITPAMPGKSALAVYIGSSHLHEACTINKVITEEGTYNAHYMQQPQNKKMTGYPELHSSNIFYRDCVCYG